MGALGALALGWWRERVDVNSITNLRECGGLPALDGRRLRSGLLYRSGDPGRARGAALRQLESLGLRTIIDLRPPDERRHGVLTLPGARTVFLPIDIAGMTRARLRGLLHRRHTEDAIIAAMDSVYRDMVDLAVAQMGALLRLLLHADTFPALIHCRAGKDRTGFACAIIQLALGIAPEAIIHDYLRSTDYTVPAAQKSLALLRLFTLGLFPIRNLEVVYAAQVRYIQTALEKIASSYGGIAAYLERGGFPGSGFASLQAQLLETP